MAVGQVILRRHRHFHFLVQLRLRVLKLTICFGNCSII